MRFTPFIFASAVAAAGYYPAPVSSSSAPAYDGGYGGYKPSSSVASSSSAVYGGYYPKSSSSSVISKKGGPKKWKTTTTYETECYTVTSSSSTKVWTSVKAIPTVCEDDDEDDYTYSKKASSTPAAPVKPTYSSVPYCAAVTETCTVTVTAGSDYTPKPYAPTKATTPVAPVYSGSYAKPSASGSGYTKPKAPEFTGAASAQKAGALLAGAGAVAAMLL